MTLRLNWTQPGSPRLGLSRGLQCDNSSWASVFPKSGAMSAHQLGYQLDMLGGAPPCSPRHAAQACSHLGFWVHAGSFPVAWQLGHLI